MVALLNKNDNSVLSKDGFVKNAVFYKDMFAFYDAYVMIMEKNTDELPGYVFYKEKYILEGICLFMKNYASEFGFETMHLTLDYLKVLYYTIASYSKDENIPERTVFEEEFAEFKATADALYESAFLEYQIQDRAYSKAKNEFDKKTNKFAKNLVWSKLLLLSSVILMIVGFVSAMVPFTFYFWNKLDLAITAVISSACFITGTGASCVCKFFSKKLGAISGENEYEIQQKKRSKDGFLETSKELYLKLAKIAAERYECHNSLSEKISEFKKSEPIEKIFEKASEYKILSYNIKVDISNIFESQNEDEKDMVANIQTLHQNSSQADLSRVYLAIKEKDWLYYNNEIRYEYIKRFMLFAENTKEWALDIAGKKIEPFGIKIKNLCKEKVAFLRSENDLFVTLAYSDLLKTNLIKNSSIIKTKTIDSAEKFRHAKMEYLSHFFSYEKTKKFNNLFSETKIKDGVKVTDEILKESQQIPTMALVELKVAENALGLSNYISPTIKQIEKIIFEYETGEKFVENEVKNKPQTIKEITAVREDMFDYAVTYTFEDGSFVGYRLSNL